RSVTSVSSLFQSCLTGAQRPFASLEIRRRPYNSLPNLTKNLAANFALACCAAAHHASRRGQNADAQSADHRADLRRPAVSARAGPGNALQTADDAAAVGRVLQEDAQHFARFVLVHELVGRDVALFLEDARDFRLELRNGNVKALMLGGHRVAEARQKIGNGIGLHVSPVLASLPRRLLPTRFHHSGNFPAQRHAAKTDAAHLKFSDIAARAATAATAVAHADLVFGLLRSLGGFCV